MPTASSCGAPGRRRRNSPTGLPSTPLETISFDVREGGRYRYTMVNIETGEEFPTGGVFLEVVPFERLVFTWGYPDAPIDIPCRDPNPHRTWRPHRDDFPPAWIRWSPRRSVRVRRLVRCARHEKIYLNKRVH